MNKIVIKFNNEIIKLKQGKIDDCEVLHILTQIIAGLSKENNFNKKELVEIVKKYYDEAE